MPAASNSLGIHEPTSATLFNDGGKTQRHPFTDLYRFLGLQKLVTERFQRVSLFTRQWRYSNMTKQTGNIGKEFCVDSGESQRFKAFYVIDRTIPVGLPNCEDNITSRNHPR